MTAPTKLAQLDKATLRELIQLSLPAGRDIASSGINALGNDDRADDHLAYRIERLLGIDPADCLTEIY